MKVNIVLQHLLVFVKCLGKMPKNLIVKYKPLLDLLEKWEGLKGDRIAPKKEDIKPSNFVEWLGYLSISEIVGSPPRFRLRLDGSIISENLNFDATGKFYEEFTKPDMYPIVIKPFLKAIETARPNYQTGIYQDTPARKRCFHRMVLPLSNDGKIIDMLLIALYIERDDIFPFDMPNFHKALKSNIIHTI